MKQYYILIFIALFMIGCSENDSKNIESSSFDDLQSQEWLFDRQYIRGINEQSWEKFSISALNDYKDIKIDFAYIHTGRSQNCRLYAKGLMMQENQNNNKDKKHKNRFLLRPNLIPQTTIIITKQENNSSSFNDYAVLLEVSNISEFIRICGDAHQYVVGEYSLQ
ncbi:hypothetical protein LS73_002315 [Helicobacter muridarum]|uniref:Lipoprotein n=1 Tax=Helicobacter muridarum TaxID=216 RepID=A0A099TXU4_9HELI|nr:hypothetical protein [Helicobacter muridarum]TLE01129.1 hypothetical protein LS73_002315 [Helicobacter muridarum]STQ85997.1 Uncharacterised protein [Helicobacter muridarum]